MFNPLRRLFSFLEYWYFRYMLVTELYMVEKWERNFITVFCLITMCWCLLRNMHCVRENKYSSRMHLSRKDWQKLVFCTILLLQGLSANLQFYSLNEMILNNQMY